MMWRRTILAGIAALAVVAVCTGGARAETPTVDAEKFIKHLANQAIKELGDKAITREERGKRFRTLFVKHFDVPTIARWVLGRYWPSATSEQRHQYLSLFEEMIVVTYSERFVELGEDVFSVTEAQLKGEKDIIVRSTLERPQHEQRVQLDWRVRDRDGEFRIIDVMVEGVSMGQTQRSEFASVIRNSGGTIDGLIEELRKRSKGGA